MRVIPARIIFRFLFYLSPCFIAVLGVVWLWVTRSAEWPMGGFLLSVLAFILFYIGLVVVYRWHLWLCPLGEGSLISGSKEEENWMIYILFWLIFFYPLVLPGWIPVPMTGVLFRLLGARIEPQSYFGGMIYDPPMVQIGHHVLGGARAMIIPHISEGSNLEHHRVRIGNHVTLGAASIILPGVTIEDHCIIAAGAVVSKFSHIKRGEVWGGVPARFIRFNQVP